MRSPSNQIIQKQVLGPAVKMFVVESPRIARKARAGQFVIVRIDEKGERIPLTIADADADSGRITLVIQEVGKTTLSMGSLQEGERLLDVVGPLGNPSEIEKFGTVVMIGGGIGVAPLFPIVKAMKEAGNTVISILGARNKELLFWEREITEFSDEVFVTTDDGSYGAKGLVTDPLREVISHGSPVQRVVAIGPVVMMRAVAEVTREPAIPTIVSLNPIMVDGTGMCGGCRVTVGGTTRFACVDGPEFDGHLVAFDELLLRQRMYKEEEQFAMGECRIAEAVDRQAEDSD